MLRLPSSREQFASDDLALEAMGAQIRAHRDFDNNRSLIRTAVDNISSPASQDSLIRLEENYNRAIEQRRAGDLLGLAQTLQDGRRLARQDSRELTSRNDFCENTTGFLKTATLFARGRFGLGFAVAVHALDRVNDRLPVAERIIDTGIGTAQALLTKGMFGAFESRRLATMPVSIRGVILGSGSRAIDLLANRQTYRNPDTGSFDFSHGLRAIGSSTINLEAGIADAVVFSSAHLLVGGANSFVNGAINRSPLARTMLTGTTFGMTSGAIGEIQRQRLNGETLDIGRVAKQGLTRGALDTFAAVPGGLQARAAARAPRLERSAVREPRAEADSVSTSRSSETVVARATSGDRVVEAPASQGAVAGMSAQVVDGIRGIQAEHLREHQEHVERQREDGNQLLEAATALDGLGARRGAGRTQADYFAAVNELREGQGPASGYADAILRETPPTQEITTESRGYEPMRIRTFDNADPLRVEQYNDQQWRHLFFVDESTRAEIERADDRGRLPGLQVNASDRPAVGLYPLMLNTIGRFEGGALTFPTPESGRGVPHVISERSVEQITAGNRQSNTPLSDVCRRLAQNARSSAEQFLAGPAGADDFHGRRNTYLGETARVVEAWSQQNGTSNDGNHILGLAREIENNPALTPIDYQYQLLRLRCIELVYDVAPTTFEFTTGQGSRYRGFADGTTRRTKADGRQDRSTMQVYLDPASATALGEAANGNRLEGFSVPASRVPAVGLQPLDLRRVDRPSENSGVYADGRVSWPSRNWVDHVGNPIQSIEKPLVVPPIATPAPTTVESPTSR